MSAGNALTVDEDLDQASEPLLQVSLGWVFRLVMSAALQAVWLGMILFVLALILPPTTGDGVNTNFSLNELLAMLTIAFYLPVIPLLLLPTADDERFTWFLFTAYGWILCLLGSVAALRIGGQLQLGEAPAFLEPRAVAAVIAGLCVLPLLASLFLPIENFRRLTGVVLLLLGGMALGVEALGITHVAARSAEWLGEPSPSAGMAQVLLLLLALLWVIVVASTVLPAEGFRGHVLGLSLLMWFFLLAGLLCWQLLRQEVAIVRGEGREVFYCLVITIFVAPFVSWLGMPWTKGRRLVWTACLLAAAVGVASFVQWARFDTGLNVIDQVWAKYDGPRLRSR